MLIHSVFFYLKSDLTDEQRAAFRAGVETLKDIEDASSVYVGSPAGTAERPVVDTTYDVGLTVIVDDVPAHDRYQDHPIHHAFVNEFKTYWDRVQIYDVE